MAVDKIIKTPAIGSSLFEIDQGHSNLIYVWARGGFELSDVTSIRTNLNRSPVFLNPDRLVLVEFVESCCGSPAFFEAVRSQAYSMVEMGFAAKRVAFVISPDIKRDPESIESYEKAFSEAGITIAFFETVPTAKNWLLAHDKVRAGNAIGLPPPHCKLTKFETDNQHPHLIRISCHSPFNLEFLESAIETQGSDIRFLNDKRVELISFIGDCTTASEGFYKRWADHIVRELTMGFAPKRIAIMVGASEKGRETLVNRLLDLFEASAPYMVKDFTSVKDAEEWLLR